MRRGSQSTAQQYFYVAYSDLGTLHGAALTRGVPLDEAVDGSAPPPPLSCRMACDAALNAGGDGAPKRGGGAAGRAAFPGPRCGGALAAGAAAAARAAARASSSVRAAALCARKGFRATGRDLARCGPASPRMALLLVQSKQSVLAGSADTRSLWQLKSPMFVVQHLSDRVNVDSCCGSSSSNASSWKKQRTYLLGSLPLRLFGGCSGPLCLKRPQLLL